MKSLPIIQKTGYNMSNERGANMELTALLQRIDTLKNRIQARRPLSETEVRELDAYYKIGTTYSSNALEGNSLTLSETKVILEDGLTVNGKPIKDVYEATGHADAYDFMVATARGGQLHITEDVICAIHKLFYQRLNAENAGAYRQEQVFISGTDYVPPAADAVPELMRVFAAEIAEKQAALHPVLLAAFVHRRLVDIHPFVDGNGRTARLLMNLVLVNRGYPVVQIPPVLRFDYIQALVAAQRSEKPTDIPFQTLIASCQLESQRDFCRMFRISMKELEQGR